MARWWLLADTGVLHICSYRDSADGTPFLCVNPFKDAPFWKATSSACAGYPWGKLEVRLAQVSSMSRCASYVQLPAEQWRLGELVSSVGIVREVRPLWFRYHTLTVWLLAQEFHLFGVLTNVWWRGVVKVVAVVKNQLIYTLVMIGVAHRMMGSKLVGWLVCWNCARYMCMVIKVSSQSPAVAALLMSGGCGWCVESPNW